MHCIVSGSLTSVTPFEDEVMGQAAYGACEMQENLSAPGAGGEGLAAPAPTALAVLRFYDGVTD